MGKAPFWSTKNSQVFNFTKIICYTTQVCDMVFQVNGIPEKYITLGVELPRGCDTCTGSEYRGSKSLVEYIVGDSVMDLTTNGTELYGIARVVTIFKRRWIYHLITVFLQSILLNIVSYITFFFKLYNFQDHKLTRTDRRAKSCIPFSFCFAAWSFILKIIAGVFEDYINKKKEYSELVQSMLLCLLIYLKSL